MKKAYTLTAEQLKGIANLCYQEQGSVPGAAAEASLMCNLFEKQKKYTSLYDYVRDGGWFAHAGFYMDNGESPDSVAAAVRDVIINGNRTLPDYIDEHDCLSDIESISTGNKNNRSAYVKDRTIIRNKYGSVYTFYCFPAPASDPFGYTNKPAEAAEERAEESSPVPAPQALAACDWMEAIAKDPAHGYDQAYRWGERGDYDCSSMVITAYERAGVPVKTAGATYTGDMKEVFIRCGFEDITYDVDRISGKGMLRGDVLLNEVHHTAMYCGNSKEVEASVNEFGKATGGQPGDQTGREILIRSYRNYPWDCVLRYTGIGGGRPVLQYGSVGKDVSDLQRMLNDQVSASLAVDGEFGMRTEAAAREYQQRYCLDVDGIVGSQTWACLERSWTVIKTPGIIRQSPRKESKVVVKLQAGDKVEALGVVLNDIGQKWAVLENGYMILDNLS